MDINQLKYEYLKRYFGHDGFRSGQESLVDHILGGGDVLGIMPTGAGKSVCYQLPALIMPGLTLVISPLISLMKDQVSSLIQSGISAAYINSSLTAEQYERVIERAAQGGYKIIYVAPERLTAHSFVRLAASLPISMIAVDEAHCVSQWGQDFRPSYLNIAAFARSLPKRPVMAAFTATATDEVKADIERMLALRSPFSLTTGFDRKNLYFAVSEPHDKLAETLRLVRAAGEKSGIIYCSTRKNTELVCEYLCRAGIPCTRYHAGLSDEERRSNQDDFLYDRVRLMAATNAFGMGIDKSNVSFVIHFNMPKNLESYYQEAGRAGRDGSEAVCTLLYSRQDVRTAKFLIERQNENAEGDMDEQQRAALREREYKRLAVMVKYCTTTDCLRHFILRYFGESSGEMCAKCSNCAVGFETEDVTLAAQKILSCVYRLAQRGLKMGAAAVADILRGSKSKRVLSLRLDELSTYGIMADTPTLKIRAIIEGLCDRGYLRRGEYESLILTAKAREILFDGVSLSMPFKKAVAKHLPQSAGMTRTSERIGESEELFALLRGLRTELAHSEGVPAYIIFSDATLHDMCVKQPKDETEFLYVSGVGKTKAERYGRQFTRVIREWAASSAAVDVTSELALARRRKSQQVRELAAEERSAPKPKPKPTPTPTPAPQTIEELAERLAKKAGCEPQLLQAAILRYLVENEFLRECGGEFAVMPRGGLLGIAMTTRVNSGRHESVIKYRRAAQQMIEENLDVILQSANSL